MSHLIPLGQSLRSYLVSTGSFAALWSACTAHLRLGLGVVVLLASMVVGGYPEASELTSVKFRQSWTPSEQYIPFVVADAKGFYEEEGLKVETLVGRGSGLAVKLVGSGTEQFGHADASEILLGASKGVPVLSVASILRTMNLVIVSHADNPIRRPSDLVGRTVGETSAAFTYVLFKAAMEHAGVDLAKIRVVDVTGAARVTSFLGRRIEGFVAYPHREALDLITQGAKIHMLPLSDLLGSELPGKGIIVNADYARQNPDVVRRFVRASIKGFYYTRENPKESIDLLLARYPELDRRLIEGRLAGEVPIVWTDQEKHGFGWHNRDEWKQMVGVLKQAGLIAAPIDLDKVITDEYLPKRR